MGIIIILGGIIAFSIWGFILYSEITLLNSFIKKHNLPDLRFFGNIESYRPYCITEESMKDYKKLKKLKARHFLIWLFSLVGIFLFMLLAGIIINWK
jgi:hypothetical protein